MALMPPATGGRILRRSSLSASEEDCFASLSVADLVSFLGAVLWRRSLLDYWEDFTTESARPLHQGFWSP